MTRAWSGHPDYPYRYVWDFADDPPPVSEPASVPPDMAFVMPEEPVSVGFLQRIRRWFSGRR